jgi:hypothetical protein
METSNSKSSSSKIDKTEVLSEKMSEASELKPITTKLSTRQRIARGKQLKVIAIICALFTLFVVAILLSLFVC